MGCVAIERGMSSSRPGGFVCSWLSPGGARLGKTSLLGAEPGWEGAPSKQLSSG